MNYFSPRIVQTFTNRVTLHHSARVNTVERQGVKLMPSAIESRPDVTSSLTYVGRNAS